jgi:hypothetical protein
VIPPPGGDLPGNPAPEGPGIKERPAFCAKYPKLRTNLAKQLKAAKKARVKAATPKARKAAVKRIAAVKASQRKATARFRATCRTAAVR